MLIFDASVIHLPLAGAYFRRAEGGTTTTTSTEIRNGQQARRLPPQTSTDAAAPFHDCSTESEPNAPVAANPAVGAEREGGSSWTRSRSSQTRPSRLRHSAGAPRLPARARAPSETLRTWTSPSRNQSAPGAASRAGTLLKLGSVMAQVALPSSASRALSTGMGGAPGDPQ